MKKRLLSVLLALCMSLTLLPGMAWASVEDGQVDLKPTNELKWIDRVDLPDYALTLYETLEEAADGDGYKDYLIDDQYYDLEGDDICTDVPGEFMRGTVTFSDGSKTRYTAILVTTTKISETDQNTKDYIANCIRTVMSAFWRDHSEVFWTHGIYRIEINRNGTKYYCLALCADRSAPKEEDSTYYEIRIKDFRPGEKWDIRRAMARQDADIKTILSAIPTGADRLTQIYYINDWLTENNGYNTEVSNWLAKNNGNNTDVPSSIRNLWYVTRSITALEGREGVEGPDCGGYASAFKVLCDALDIPCVNVHGTTASGRSHRWNYVQMEDGNWYALDPCYNDNRKDRTRYLLVGAQTVVNKVKFVENHIETNPAYYGGVESFMNGPVLNDEAYPRSVRLAYWGLPETLTTDDSVVMTPVLIFASDANYTYSSTPLPEGLTLNPDTGEITGTITGDAEMLNVTVTATNPTNPADTARCTLEFPLPVIEAPDILRDAVSVDTTSTGAVGTVSVSVPETIPNAQAPIKNVLCAFSDSSDASSPATEYKAASVDEQGKTVQITPQDKKYRTVKIFTLDENYRPVCKPTIVKIQASN